MSFPDTIRLKKSEVIRTGTTQVVPLGTRGSTGDGRIFRYAKAGGAINPGRMVQMEAPGAILSVAQTSNLVLATDFGTTIGTTWGGLAIRMTKSNVTGIAVNEFAEGFIYVGGTGLPTGRGQMFQIKSHNVMTPSSTQYVEFVFADGEKPETAFTTDVAIGVCKNSYADAIQVVTGAEPTAPVIGVAVSTAASADFLWVQTWGKCVAYVGAATTARGPLIGATDAAVTGLALGSVATGGDSQPSINKNEILAVSPNVIVAGGWAPVELKISP